ncbi:hypothetical protein [Bacillus phage Nachito]|nr:hypothetical protein [Bacillus phage Nachito]
MGVFDKIFGRQKFIDEINRLEDKFETVDFQAKQNAFELDEAQQIIERRDAEIFKLERTIRELNTRNNVPTYTYIVGYEQEGKDDIVYVGHDEYKAEVILLQDEKHYLLQYHNEQFIQKVGYEEYLKQKEAKEITVVPEVDLTKKEERQATNAAIQGSNLTMANESRLITPSSGLNVRKGVSKSSDRLSVWKTDNRNDNDGLDWVAGAVMSQNLMEDITGVTEEKEIQNVQTESTFDAMRHYAEISGNSSQSIVDSSSSYTSSDDSSRSYGSSDSSSSSSYQSSSYSSHDSGSSYSSSDSSSSYDSSSSSSSDW